MQEQDELDRIARALGAQPDPQRVLVLLLSEARRLTHAEAGTVYLRRGDQLHLAVVQNDVLARRVGEDEVRRRLQLAPLGLSASSIAGYVALTRGSVNLPDVYEIPLERPYVFDRRMDAQHGYRTRSMLAMPVRDTRGGVFGVLQLINALNEGGEVIPFDTAREGRVAALLTALARLTPASKTGRPT